MRCEYLIETGFDKADPDRLEQPQAVERWFCNEAARRNQQTEGLAPDRPHLHHRATS